MALITMHSVCWGLGGAPLLDNIQLQIEKGERLCLLGRNGVGKSTLINLLTGTQQPDNGEIQRQQGLTTATLEQEVPRTPHGTLFEIVAEGLGALGRALIRYRKLSESLTLAGSQKHLDEYQTLQHQLDTADGWSLTPRIEDLLARIGLNSEQDFKTLSAGMKRRVFFCRAAVSRPEIGRAHV